VKDVRQLLEAQRETERLFAEEAADQPPPVTGWSSALLMFHVSGWRERLRDALTRASQGLPVPVPPADVDAVNNAELPLGAGIPLNEAARRSDETVRRLLDLWEALGDRPFKWYRANTTGEALIRISYFHPRNHLAEYFVGRGDRAGGYGLYDESARDLRRAGAPTHTLGPALYRLACARVAVGRLEEAFHLLAEALPMHAEVRAAAAANPELAPLKANPRFRAMLKE
jgi:hypothetical protein